MDTCYCVFWFPTIFHREKTDRRKGENFIFKEPQSISDKDKQEKDLFLEVFREPKGQGKIKFDPNDQFNLKFKLTDKDSNGFEILFKWVNQTRNGFVIYSYDREQLINDYYSIIAQDRINDDDNKKNETIDTLFLPFYYFAKLFYHEHEVDTLGDGRYHSYFFTQKDKNSPKEYLREIPSLSSKNNPVINWYIDQFEERITNNAEDISRKLREWTPAIEDYFNIKEYLAKKLAGEKNEENLESFIKGLQSHIGVIPFGTLKGTIDDRMNFLKDYYHNKCQELKNSTIRENYEKIRTSDEEITDEADIETAMRLLQAKIGRNPTGYPDSKGTKEDKKKYLENLKNIAKKLDEFKGLDSEKKYSSFVENIRSLYCEALAGNNDGMIEIATKVLQALMGEETSGTPKDSISIDDRKNFFRNLYHSNISVLTQNYYKDSTMLLTLCNNSLIEYTYCKTLLESKYNDSFKHDSEFSAIDFMWRNFKPELREKDRCRKIAFNIRNSIRYIETAKRKCEVLQNRISETMLDEIHDLSSTNTKLTEKVNKSNKRTTVLTWVSVGLGILSFLLGVWSVCLAKNDAKKNNPTVTDSATIVIPSETKGNIITPVNTEESMRRPDSTPDNDTQDHPTRK